jgi:hypothetical protein
VAHVKKFNRAACGHLFKHFERAKDEDGMYVKFSNQSIDEERTHRNYNLGPERGVSQGDYVRRRCGEVRMQQRADVNVLCSWIVTAPKDLPPEENDKFFEATYNFLSARYGGEKNVVSAFVHMDETTPHMHFAFVPVVADVKRGGFKLSAKEAVDLAELKRFHPELSAAVAAALGHEVAIENGVVKERGGNLTIAQLKAQGNRADKLQRENDALEKQNDALRGAVAANETKLADISAEIMKLTVTHKQAEAALREVEGRVTEAHQEATTIVDSARQEASYILFDAREEEVACRTTIVKLREDVSGLEEKLMRLTLTAQEIDAINKRKPPGMSRDELQRARNNVALIQMAEQSPSVKLRIEREEQQKQIAAKDARIAELTREVEQLRPLKQVVRLVLSDERSEQLSEPTRATLQNFRLVAADGDIGKAQQNFNRTTNSLR